jgi:hypothetical protein
LVVLVTDYNTLFYLGNPPDPKLALIAKGSFELYVFVTFIEPDATIVLYLLKQQWQGPVLLVFLYFLLSVSRFLLFYFVDLVFLRQGLTMYPRLASNM